MRLIYILAFSLFFNGLFAQDVRDIVIFEEFNSTPISKVIRTLKNNYKLKFAYDDALISGLTITGVFNNVRITDFLDDVLPDNGIDYQILNGKFILIPKAIETETKNPTLFNFTLSGVVRDRLTGETLPNALVRVAGSPYATVTNKDGRFLLPSVPTDTSTIEFSYLGYKINNAKLEPGSDKTSMNVQMREQTTNLRSVTVQGIPSETVKIGEQVGQLSMNPRKLTNLSSLGEQDIFRTLQLLPGISGTDESSAGLTIRGSDPSQNLILFDGFTLYRLDHFFGVFSAINADAVKDVQIFKSGFVPKYGGRIAGVVDITGKSGNRMKPEFDLGMNLLSARFSAQAPLFNKKGSFIVTGRRAFTDVIQSDLYKKLITGARENSTDLETFDFNRNNQEILPDFHFYDVNAKFSVQPTTDQLFSLTLYKGNDNLLTESERSFENAQNVVRVRDILEERADWGNQGVSVSWSKQWNRQYYSRIYAASSSFAEDYSFDYQFDLDDNGRNERFDYAIAKDNDIQESQISIENEVFIDEENRVDFGLNASKIKMSNEILLGVNDRFGFSEEGNIYGLYVNEKYTPNEKLTLQAGLRYTITGLVQKNFLSPRVALSYQTNPNLNFKFSIGRYQQLIHEVVQDDPYVGENTFWTLADGVNLPAIKSTNYAMGFHYKKGSWNLDVEYFNKDASGLAQTLVSHMVTNGQSDIDIRFSRGTNKINGVDVLLQKDVRNFSTWVAYTYLNANNQFDFVNGGEELPALQDQRHELKFVNMLNLSKVNLSATWIYGSGKPFFEPEINFIRNAQNEIVNFEVISTNKTVRRLPVYNRIDFSAAYKFGSEGFKGEVGISFLNVLGKENILSKRLDIAVLENSRGRVREPSSDLLFRDIQLLDFTSSIFLKIKF